MDNNNSFKLGKTCTKTRKCVMAFLCALLLIIIVVVPIYSFGKETFKMPISLKQQRHRFAADPFGGTHRFAADPFGGTHRFAAEPLVSRKNPLMRPLREEDPQPLYFKNQKLSVPKNCHPHYGCVNTPGPSAFEPDEYTYCTEAWRDCAAYRDCIDGKCIIKRRD